MSSSTIRRAGRTPREASLDSVAIYRIALGEKAKPDDWQQALMDEEWPQVLVAPTGSGKTAAVTLGWAAHRLRSPDMTPRRLVWCLPMRTLAEQTADVIRDWFGRLMAEANDATRLPGPGDVHGRYRVDQGLVRNAPPLH